MLSYARTQPVSPLRSLALSRLGASPRVAIGHSPIKEAGRAAYAVTDVPAGGFLVLYTGCWYAYTGREYRGTSRNVVESDSWRIIPKADDGLGKVSPADHMAAMFNEPAPGVRVRPTSCARHA